MAVVEIVPPKGKYKDDSALRDTINYILNPAKVPEGCVILRGVTSASTAAQQMDILAQAYGKNKGTRLRHFILSFDADENVDAQTAFEVGWRLSDYYAGQYQLVGAVHQNTDHLHIHFVMNTVGAIDGKKYSGKKKDYYDFGKYVRAVLSEYDLILQKI